MNPSCEQLSVSLILHLLITFDQINIRQILTFPLDGVGKITGDATKIK